MPSHNELYQNILADIKRVIEEEQIEPHQLTSSRYGKLGDFPPSDLAKVGGLRAILNDEFAPVEKDLGQIFGQQTRAKYLKRLEHQIGDMEYFTGSVTRAITESFSAHPFPAKIKKAVKLKHDSFARENVAFVSDTHFGINIDNREVPTNEFNWRIACRRMAKFTHQIATYKIEHRAQSPQLRLCLGGDLAQGVIHASDHGTQLITEQVHGTIWILTQMIEYLRDHYKRIVVECTPCNHLRLPHKGPDRAYAQKWDSFATMIHLSLQLAFRSSDDVVFNIPKTPYTEFDVVGHHFYMTHGDTVIQTGNVGRTVNIAQITEKSNKLHNAHKIRVLMMGHVHTPLNTLLSNGIELIVNGTGSGPDPYAQSVGYEQNNSCQVMFEATRDYPVGDFRKVYLADAGKVDSWDAIIQPYLATDLINPPSGKKR